MGQIGFTLILHTWNQKLLDHDRKAGEVRNLTVPGEEFIRRFLLHAIPLGFTRIRHYGFLSSRRKRDLLEKCRNALGERQLPESREKISTEAIFEKMGIDPSLCPHCKEGRLKKIYEIPKTRWPFYNSS